MVVSLGTRRESQKTILVISAHEVLPKSLTAQKQQNCKGGEMGRGTRRSREKAPGGETEIGETLAMTSGSWEQAEK